MYPRMDSHNDMADGYRPTSTPTPLARCVLFSRGQMKNFLIVILVVGAVGYYFDISPTDFLPSLPNTPQPRGQRHASAVAVKDITPVPTAAPTAPRDDGALANRWKP